MIDITPVVNAVLALLAAVLTVHVIPWLKGKVSEQKHDDLYAWVRILVAAAEQTYSQNQGTEKKSYVLERLYEKGFTVRAEDIDDAIEAAVLALHHELGVRGA